MNLPIINISKLEDIKLLELVCASDNDDAYREFVNRFYSCVKEECLLKCQKRKVDSHIGEQIAHDTFERVKRYKSFDKTKLKSTDQRKAIKGWLYRILSNLFYDYHRKVSKTSETPDFFINNLTSEVGSLDSPDLLSKKEMATLIFGKLNKKEKEVILTDIEYKRGHKYLPPDILDSLADRINVKKNTVRKIRERAITKIKNAIDEINN